jgi:hypothetical protein
VETSTLVALLAPLVALGGADLQVPRGQAARLRELLREAGRDGARVELLEGLDHLLRPVDEGRTGLGPYVDPDRRVFPGVVRTVADFVEASCRR